MIMRMPKLPGKVLSGVLLLAFTTLVGCAEGGNPSSHQADKTGDSQKKANDSHSFEVGSVSSGGGKSDLLGIPYYATFDDWTRMTRESYEGTVSLELQGEEGNPKRAKVKGSLPLLNPGPDRDITLSIDSNSASSTVTTQKLGFYLLRVTFDDAAFGEDDPIVAVERVNTEIKKTLQNRNPKLGDSGLSAHRKSEIARRSAEGRV